MLRRKYGNLHILRSLFQFDGFWVIPDIDRKIYFHNLLFNQISTSIINSFIK